MANAEDVQLAKRLLQAGLVGDEQLRAAFAIQERLLDEQDRDVRLPRVLYHLKVLPADALAAAVGPTPLESQPFEGYRLDRVVGDGGTAVVYGGVYLENGADVALKVLDPIHALRPDWLARFQREGRVLLEVESEAIVLGYEQGQARGFHFVSMELLEGLTVYEVIGRRGALSNDEALSIALQMARALACLHEAGYINRDVKPENVMVEATGRAVMIDLGFTRAVAEGLSDDDTEDTTVGTVEYLSPEQARGRKDLDPRADIYSLGVSLYHMVVGDVPFRGESDMEVLAKQVLQSFDSQKVKQRRIAPEVQFFITKMMSKDREHRYETIHEVIPELEAYVRSEPVPVDLGKPPSLTPIAPPPGSDVPPARGAPEPKAPTKGASRRGAAPVRRRRRPPRS